MGAGFSNDAGIPLQDELLPKFLFEEENQEQIGTISSDLSKIFSFEYKKPKSLSLKDDANSYPNLEDIFSAIDTAIINDEYLKEFPPEYLKKFREKLVLGILDLINKSIEDDDYIKEFSKALTDYRLDSRNNDPFAIITTNWDIVLLSKFKNYHNELIDKCPFKKRFHNLKQLEEDDRKKVALLDYCLYTHPLTDEKNHIPSLKIEAMGYKNIKLLYLHGSPTWLYCKKCKKMFSPPSYGKSTKKVALVNMLEPKQCPKCYLNSTLSHEDFEKVPKTSGNSTKVYKEESVTRSKSKSSLSHVDSTLTHVLIMPTYYKIIQNVHLLDVWQNAAMELQEATGIFFIGYSLPEADYLIRNLLVSNLNKDATIYISSIEEKFEDSEAVKNYKQIFGNRIKKDNYRGGKARSVVVKICERIEKDNYKKELTHYL